MIDTHTEECIKSLFQAWDVAHIDYCLWKSYDRWHDSLNGETDIDLLFDHNKFDEFHSSLLSFGWLPLKAEAWRKFDKVYDYVLWDKDKWLHMHAHGQIVTGDKFLKSFRPSLNDMYFENSRNTTFPKHVDPHIEFILFILRFSLKLQWIDYARIIRRLSFKALSRDFMSEYIDLKQRCNRQELTQFLSSEPLSWVPEELILKAFDDFTTLNYFDRYKLQRRISPYRQGNSLSRFLYTYKRKFQKHQQGTGKFLAFEGISIAICGADGSGKTSVVNAVQSILNQHFATKKVYMGGNRSSGDFKRNVIIKSFLLPYLICRKLSKIIGALKLVKYLEHLYFSQDALLIAEEKLSRFTHAQKIKSQGGIILFERFPIFKGYGDNGPKETDREYRESIDTYYEQIKFPDALFIIDVSEKTALSRRNDESEQVLREKVRSFKNYINTWSNSECELVIINEECSIEENAHYIVKYIFNELKTSAKEKSIL